MGQQDEPENPRAGSRTRGSLSKRGRGSDGPNQTRVALGEAERGRYEGTWDVISDPARNRPVVEEEGRGPGAKGNNHITVAVAVVHSGM